MHTEDFLFHFHSFSELPVKILGKTDAKTEKQFLVSDDIILVCELSRSNASVSWYKGNQLIDDTERYCSEEQGVFRSLVVLNAGLEDSGEYTCDAVDDKMVFYITVKGNHIIKPCKCHLPFLHSGYCYVFYVQSLQYRSLETRATQSIISW